MTDRILWDKLKMLRGLPPHDSPANICYGDVYFANSIERDFRGTISELAERVGLPERERKWRIAKELADSILDYSPGSVEEENKQDD